MQKKVLFIHHGWGIGGAPISLLKLVLGLREKGYLVKVIFLKNSDVVSLFAQEAIDHEVVSGWFYSKFYKYWQHTETKNVKWFQIHIILRDFVSWMLSAFYFAPRILRHEQPDILHLNSIVLTDWCYAARQRPLKLFVHVRETLAKGSWGIRRAFIRKLLASTAQHIIAISKDVAERVGLKDLVTVVYNPFEFPQLPTAKKAKKKVVYLGGASEIKGFGVLLKALPLIDTDIEVMLLGYYPEDFNPKQDNVSILGVVSQDEVGKQLADSALLVVPTVKPHFARPVIEAYAMRTAAIGFNIKGMDEIILHGETGFLIRPDAASLADRINTEMQNLLRLEHLGEAGYRFAADHFSVTSSVNAVHALYLSE